MKTIQPQTNSGNVIRLAEKLCGRAIADAPNENAELLTGIDIERRRLGNKRYLALLNRKVYDIDGLTDYVYLLESFDRSADAITYVDQAAQALCLAQIRQPDEFHSEWRLESEGEIPFIATQQLPTTGVWANRIRVMYDRTYKLRATDYDTQYNCFRVVGPFRGAIVSEQLVSFVNENWELRSFFAGIGGDKFEQEHIVKLRANLPLPRLKE